MNIERWAYGPAGAAGGMFAGKYNKETVFEHPVIHNQAKGGDNEVE